MSAARRFAALFVVMLSTAGSAVHAGEVTPVSRTQLKDIRLQTLNDDYAAERDYRPLTRRQPVLGLALSGGGTKAAMFAHGVLQGLHDRQVLEKVDAISSVSGGSYAAYWYFTKMIEAQRQGYVLSQIFDDCLPAYWTEDDTGPSRDAMLLRAAMARAVKQATEQQTRPAEQSGAPTLAMPRCDDKDHFARGDPYRFQAHLVRWPDVLQEQPVKLTGGKQLRKPEAEMGHALMAEFLRRARFSKDKEDAIPLLYQYGIERTWGLSPIPRHGPYSAAVAETSKWQYSNSRLAQEFPGLLRVDAQTSTWADLHALYAGAALIPSTTALMPLWIVNSNLTSKSLDASKNLAHIFEMTPFGYGADGDPQHKIGYVNDVASMPIRALGKATRASAGFADAQGIESRFWSPVVNFLGQVIPGFRWGVPVSIMTADGQAEAWRLSDGGGAENLGVYTLLKRGLRDIVVVDTAQDVEGDMGDICTLKAALKKQAVELQFPALSRLEDVCGKKKLRYNLSAWMNPVVEGSARWIDGDQQPRVSRIWLVKAGWNQRAVADAYTNQTCGTNGQPSCFLTVFYGHNSTVRLTTVAASQRTQTHTTLGIRSDTGNMIFPQLPTAGTTVNSSSYLFWGFRELGRSAVSRLSVNADTGQIELADKQCLQEALPRRKYLRPANFVTSGRPLPCIALANIAFDGALPIR